MNKNKQITVLNVEINIKGSYENNFISLTDIAKHKNIDAPADIIKNWLRNKNTIEFLGLWEKLHNPDFTGSNSTSLKRLSKNRKSNENNKNKL